jgi:hypothetical protein
MELLTPEHRERLLANDRNPDDDHIPVVKFFNPIGPGTWLATMMEEDGTLWGLADLNMDCVEYGSFALSELAALDVGLGLGIERDILFETRTRLSTWLEIANRTGSLLGAARIIGRMEREGSQP